MIEKVSPKLKTRKVIKKSQNQEKKWKTPKNKIQILIDDVVVQKLISAMGFGAVIWVIWILIFQGGIWFFRAVSRKAKNSQITQCKNLSSKKRLETVLMTE